MPLKDHVKGIEEKVRTAAKKITAEEWALAKKLLLSPEHKNDALPKLPKYAKNSATSDEDKQSFIQRLTKRFPEEKKEDLELLKHAFKRINGEVYAVIDLGENKDKRGGGHARVKMVVNDRGTIFALRTTHKPKGPRQGGEEIETTDDAQEKLIEEELGSNLGESVRNLKKATGIESDRDQVYKLMPYKGEALSELLRSSNQVSKETEKERIAIGIQLAWQVAALHRGFLSKKTGDEIFHGDIKPDNVTLDSKGRVHLIDFGESKKTKLDKTTSQIDGTPEYMPASDRKYNKGKNTERQFGEIDAFALKRALYFPEIFRNKLSIQCQDRALTPSILPKRLLDDGSLKRILDTSELTHDEKSAADNVMSNPSEDTSEILEGLTFDESSKVTKKVRTARLELMIKSNVSKEEGLQKEKYIKDDKLEKKKLSDFEVEEREVVRSAIEEGRLAAIEVKEEASPPEKHDMKPEHIAATIFISSLRGTAEQKKELTQLMEGNQNMQDAVVGLYFSGLVKTAEEINGYLKNKTLVSDLHAIAPIFSVIPSETIKSAINERNSDSRKMDLLKSITAFEPQKRAVMVKFFDVLAMIPDIKIDDSLIKTCRAIEPVISGIPLRGIKSAIEERGNNPHKMASLEWIASLKPRGQEAVLRCKGIEKYLFSNFAILGEQEKSALQALCISGCSTNTRELDEYMRNDRLVSELHALAPIIEIMPQDRLKRAIEESDNGLNKRLKIMSWFAVRPTVLKEKPELYAIVTLYMSGFLSNAQPSGEILEKYLNDKILVSDLNEIAPICEMIPRALMREVIEKTDGRKMARLKAVAGLSPEKRRDLLSFKYELSRLTSGEFLSVLEGVENNHNRTVTRLEAIAAIDKMRLKPSQRNELIMKVSQKEEFAKAVVVLGALNIFDMEQDVLEQLFSDVEKAKKFESAYDLIKNGSATTSGTYIKDIVSNLSKQFDNQDLPLIGKDMLSKQISASIVMARSKKDLSALIAHHSKKKSMSTVIGLIKECTTKEELSEFKSHFTAEGEYSQEYNELAKHRHILKKFSKSETNSIKMVHQLIKIRQEQLKNLESTGISFSKEIEESQDEVGLNRIKEKIEGSADLNKSEASTLREKLTKMIEKKEEDFILADYSPHHR